MKKLKTMTITFLFAFGLFSTAAEAKPASVMLREGLYAEEVEGNIDAAIKIYEQIVQDKSASRDNVAQALYRQGMCYTKKKDDAGARTVFGKLVAEYSDQTEIIEKVKPLLDDLVYFDPADLMPPGTLIYVELGSPGKQVETILNTLKGTPYENPLAAVYQSAQTGDQPVQKTSGDIVGALLNPSMMAEFKKVRGMAFGVTGVSNNPPMIAVLYPGKSDALRGLIMAGLSMAGTPGEPIEGMQTINIKNAGAVAYDDTIILIAQPAEQLKWCVRQYKGLISEPTLASSNKSFAKVSKKARHDNVLTGWVNVDETYARVREMFPPGQVPKEVFWADAIADFNHIDYMTFSSSIEQDSCIDTTEIVFKDGHHCLAYDLIRTPNISKAAFEAVPSDAIAIASFALSAKEPQASTIRVQIKNVTGLDIGREIFANVEQVTIFAMPPKTSNPFLPEYIGLVITSHNPQQTRQILAKTLGTADAMLSGRPAPDANLPAGRYQVGMAKDKPIYCYVEQQGNATILSLNPDVTHASVAAIKDHNSVCTAGLLSSAVAKMPASASKMILVNAGGAIRLAGPTIAESLGGENRDVIQDNLNQLALACDKTTVEIRTDEQLNSFTLNRKLTGMPPLNQVLGPITQIAQAVKKTKVETKAAELRQAAAATILPAAKTPVIDGKPDDVWSDAHQYKIANVLYTPPSSPNDLSASYKAMWDQENLYLLVDVRDDVLKNDSNEYYYDDSIEVFIDPDNSKSSEYGENDHSYYFKWDKTNPTMGDRGQPYLKGDIKFALVTTDNGYRLEVAFPWSTLGTKPFAGAKIGLDVHVNDDDDGGERDTKITWHDTQDNAWQNPQSFGNAELAGLIGWWKFDETEGTVAADNSGNGNNGSLQGNPVWRPQGGKLGGAIELNGSGDYVKIGNEPAFDITGQITISAWVNIMSIPQEWTGIVTKGDSAWRMSVEYAQNAFHFGIARDVYLNGKTNVTPGQWHHVLCVYDGQKMSTYIDGRLDVSKPQTGPIATNDYPVAIGENLELMGRCWHGLIDDVRIYNYALSMNEITALAAGQ
ncbi:MAG: sugar-binding protein [Sedimentisphaerales bacterium]